jgi:hypothetical protein
MTEFTERGFAYTAFEYQDYRSTPKRTFSIQESSLATERKVWIGADDERAHLNEAEARIVRDALTAWLGDETEEFAVETKTFFDGPWDRIDDGRGWTDRYGKPYTLEEAQAETRERRDPRDHRRVIHRFVSPWTTLEES